MRNNSPKREGSPYFRRLAILLLCILTAAVLIVGDALSWFTATDSETNTFIGRQGDFAVDLVDIFVPPETPPDPGDVIPKTVGAKNNGSLPGFVRIMLLPTIIASDGSTALPANIGSEIILDLNNTDWVYGQDGYYYYLDRLDAGEEAESLFTTAALSDSLGDEYKNVSFKIEVKCEAVGTNKWEYRESFWGRQDAPQTGVHKQIDDVWKEFAI